MQAFNRISKTSDGDEFIKWLNDSREEIRNQVEEANGNEVYRGLGESRCITAILKEFEGATDENLMKMKSRT